jgi:site-specific DNA-methyltransferase (adenine-specific)
MKFLNDVLLGACEDVLLQVPNDFVDAIVTDPPYAMGTKVPSWEDIQKYLAGGSLDTGGDFMGKDWELPTLAALRQMYRVLKPGRFCLAFSSTRTMDVMAAGFRAAGFHYWGTRRWVHGQGFPKSMNVSKEIDNSKGAEREVIGIKPGHEDFVGRSTKGHIDFSTNSSLTGFDRPWMHDDAARAKYHLETAPATDEAKKWSGWGTALKPSWEPILVLSKGEPQEPLPGPMFFYSAKANISESTLEGEIENDHPTKKPLGLMQSLVKLVAPQKGIILDPYVGSGTTAEACIRERVQFVAIEKDPKYREIAKKRTDLVDGDAGAVGRGMDLFDELFG